MFLRLVKLSTRDVRGEFTNFAQRQWVSGN